MNPQKIDERPMNQDQTSYSIAELSSEFSVTARAIRFYEDQDLLHPGRQGQTRIYSPADRARLAWILRGKRVGFSLANIAEMLDLYNRGDGRQLQKQVTLKKCRERLEMLTRQRADIDETISELSEFCQKVEELLATK
ncbi:MAG: MerR family DNA-binding transcriptional regulator [Proteobacteria bacterium]|nr:MerR family DNA-binding transcriptional regulator [Pseudomonadota bacterium]